MLRAGFVVRAWGLAGAQGSSHNDRAL